MAEQYDIFGKCEEPPTPKQNADKVKRRWEDGFQRWSNKLHLDGTTSEGKCGYSAICDYCEDNSYGRPCVRALNEMCRKKNIKIDYEKVSFEDAWEGEFGDGKNK